MAICKFCKKEMLGSDGCVEIPVETQKGVFDPIPYGQETRWRSERETCHDCAAKRGKYHHPGCDVEECPVCHGQLISCGCLEGDDE